MKRYFIIVTIILLNVIQAEVCYTVDKNASNAYFKANASVLFISNDEIIGVNKSITGEGCLSKKAYKGTLYINACAFDTQNKSRDSHIKKILHCKEHKTIRFEFEDIRHNPNSETLSGILTINGITKKLTLTVEREVQAHKLIYQGKTVISYESFNIAPPVLAGGFLKQADSTLEIGAKVVLVKKDNND